MTLAKRLVGVPEKLWVDYMADKLIEEGVIKSIDDFEFRDATKSREGTLALSYGLLFPNYHLSLGVIYKPRNVRKGTFAGENVYYEDLRTGDSFVLSFGGDLACYGINSEGGFHKFLRAVNKGDTKRVGKLYKEFTDSLVADRALGDGSVVDSQQWADKFLEILISDYKANRKVL